MAGFTSILFPQGGVTESVDAPDGSLSDLHLDEIIAAVTAGHPNERIDRFFYIPLREVSAVEHRQEVFRDLERDEIRRPIVNLVDSMRTVQLRVEQAKELRHPLQRQGWFIYAVQTFCDTVALLHRDLARVQLTSRGLRDFACYVADYVESDVFRTMVEDTQAVQTELSKVRYILHVQDLRVHVEKYDGQDDYSDGVAATFATLAGESSKDYRVPVKERAEMNPVEAQILDCVAALYPDAFSLLDGYCRRNERFIDPTIGDFDREIRFYLYYLTFVRRFSTAGLTFCYPEVTDEPGSMSAKDAFDLALALKSSDGGRSLVKNDFRLSEPERILVVTGPNQGGKTTFARTIGQCAYLASLGCPIPAGRARLTLPDQIFTHFERQENLSTLQGKLEEELVRIHDVLSRATSASIIIMNESFSSTTASDALLIGAEIFKRIINLRCIAVYVTFLDELAHFDPACVSMVGEVSSEDASRRTFTFTRRAADGLAYADALANKYGLKHDVLRRRIIP